MLSPSEKIAFEQWAASHGVPPTPGTKPYTFRFTLAASGEYADLGTRLAAWAYQRGARDWASGMLGSLALGIGSSAGAVVSGTGSSGNSGGFTVTVGTSGGISGGNAQGGAASNNGANGQGGANGLIGTLPSAPSSNGGIAVQQGHTVTIYGAGSPNPPTGENQITNDGSAGNNIKPELTSKRVSKW